MALICKMTSQPITLQINNAADLQILITNSNDPNLYVQEIKIELPIGTHAQELTADGASIKPNVTPKDLWKLGGSASAGLVSIQPSSGIQTELTTAGINIQLNNAIINSEVGSCSIAVSIMTCDKNGNNVVITPFDLAADKYLDTFFLDNFQVQPTNILVNDNVQLTWDVKDVSNSKILLSWPDQPNGVEVTQQTSYPYGKNANPLRLITNTTFFLDAYVDQNDEKHYFQRLPQ
ncbi:hypothetical protein BH10PSE19_BH10PSE19_00760 [soil metagenome]